MSSCLVDPTRTPKEMRHKKIFPLAGGWISWELIHLGLVFQFLAQFPCRGIVDFQEAFAVPGQKISSIRRKGESFAMTLLELGMEEGEEKNTVRECQK